MSSLTTAVLLIAALIHLLPVAGMLGAGPLGRLYGIDAADPNLALLLRHRAVLFGLLGGFLLVAALRPTLHFVALWVGLVSVASFLLLAWQIGGYNAALARVVKVDWLVLLLLLLALGAQLVTRWRAGPA